MTYWAGFLFGIVFTLSLVWPVWVIFSWFKCSGGGQRRLRKIVLLSSMQAPHHRFPRRVP